ncbi:MAG: flavin reductase family protein [Proteobacteria bacterium]|nr:flavin reductase family protein [Pseudomonadota bacterium]
MSALEEPDGLAYRRALARFATGVAIVTARTSAGKAIGLTISSFNAVSLQPPLVLFSIGRNNYSLADLLATPACAINVLSHQQRQLSEQFSRSLSDKWRAVDVESGMGGAPLLPGALAHFECERYADYDGGDHVILVLRVRRFAQRPGEPLVFFGGTYRTLT